MAVRRPPADKKLVQILDTALADATRRSGDWLKCKPGCTNCCFGVFAISQLDAIRLRDGLKKLERIDAAKAKRLNARIANAKCELSKDYPGDVVTGLLDESDEAQERFAEFANEVPCPVLDPESGTCDLYDYRPMTCRAFGPPIRTEQGLGVCELCFQGATPEEIAACEMDTDADGLEAELIEKLAKRGASGQTIVAMAFHEKK